MIGPEISYIVVNYNTFDLTCKCIESIIKWSSGFSYEIILVDNGSEEVSPEAFKKKFSDITLVVSPSNIGFAKGNNLGIEVANGEYIFLLNSDAELLDNAGLKFLEFLEREPEVGVVTGKLFYPDGQVQNNCQRFPNWKVAAFEFFRLQKLFKNLGQRYLLGPFFTYNEKVEVDWVWGTCFMFRKKDLQTFPEQKLNEDFFMYGEDIQWCMEFKRRGKKIVFLPQVKVLHHLGGSSGKREKLQKENMERLLKMYYSNWEVKSIKLFNKLLEV